MDGYGFWVAPFLKRGDEPGACIEGDVENQTCNQEREGFVEETV